MVTWGVLSMLSLGGIVGCGVEQPLEDGSELQSVVKSVQEDNGLSLNGLSLNGLSLNGLSLNGLSLNGLNSDSFRNWFISADGGNVASHDLLMSYLVRCALPAGESVSFRHPLTQANYVWSGSMGLASNWKNDGPTTEEEQQVVTACLAAHVNNYGFHVPISLLGKDSEGRPIPRSAGELDLFDQQEACFFGNIFVSNPKLYVGSFDALLSPEQSTPRPCGMTEQGKESSPMASCSQMQRIGQCRARCQPSANTADGKTPFFETCTVGGVTYRPITTRIRSEDVNTCGDGICQRQERRGPGYTPDSCSTDCGK